MVEEGGSRFLELEIRAPRSPKAFSGYVTLETSLRELPEVRLRFSGVASLDIGAEPSGVRFPRPEPSRASTAEVRVSSLTGRDFELTRVEDPEGAVDVSVERAERGYLLKLTLKKEPNKKGVHVLKVFTDQEDQPVVQIPYSVGVAGPRVPALDSIIRRRRLPMPSRVGR